MPKLWDATIESHRATVRDTILDATWRLVVEHGLLSVTMSQIAEQTGIGRATLYKYFPDVESILLAQHDRQVAEHLARLAKIRDRSGAPGKRLDALVHQYALICYQRGRHGSPELAALLHRGESTADAHHRLVTLFRDLLAAAAATGEVRTDVPPAELATYCLHALNAAADLPSEAAVRRLGTVTLAGLR